LKCIDYPDGLQVKSQEDESLFTLNGIQTLSGLRYDLYNELQEMKSMGVDIIRMSPRSRNMKNIINAYYQEINQTDGASYSISENCNGYWHGEPGMLQNTL
ncbi:MAG: U32 family peptidase, partial [Gammaproteobacteria bacterium]|nr:U32 family peptidase [Gammaproteobacteria bacterium]